MGLTDLLRIEDIVPQEGLRQVLNLLFSGVSNKTRCELAPDS